MMSGSLSYPSLLIIVIAAIVIRWCVSLGPYSGAGKKPMFGDYEAQRHWQEITVNTPIKEWYEATPDNDLQYWGLDYPPLTAYHSWLCGMVARKMNPDWVALNSSRGFESPQHKLFMRYTVLVADVVIFFPAILVFCFTFYKSKQSIEKLLFALLMLQYPGLILIDHGHFQYNSVSLGLALWGIIGLLTNHSLLGSIAFSLALNYKQMELYHAMPFFCFLLGRCFKEKKLLWTFVKIFMLGVVVIGTFLLCWFPFLSSISSALQVLDRLFPFQRGLYEDKVANFWCTVSVLVKLRQIFSLQTLIRISLAATSLFLLPSSVHLTIYPSVRNFILALINSSLVFFLFSFQVHEKSILLAALPVCLLLPEKPLEFSWFLIMSTFSMTPLLQKDGLMLAYVAMMVFFVVFSRRLFKWKTKVYTIKLMFWLSMAGVIALHVASLLVKPPKRYPDLFPVLVSSYSCAHFLLFLVYCHYLQFTSHKPTGAEEIKTSQKKKDS